MKPELNREYPDPGEAKLIEEMVKVNSSALQVLSAMRKHFGGHDQKKKGRS